ncbi:MAG: SRPBCC domain-containing protein [Firmicutes bacterium]|nr:SRPBCC domain-containing protein [Bacillota bacterium]
MEVRARTFVLASPERVYDALATPEGLNGWFTSEAVLEARPGGRLHLGWRDWGVDRTTVEDDGHVVEASRPDRLVWRWHPDTPSYTTEVAVTLQPRDGGTVVEVVESGFAADEGGRAAFVQNAVGWGETLTLLKVYLEYGIRARWS